MRSKRNRKQIMSVLFALLNILLLCNGVAFAAPNAIEETHQQYQVKRSSNGYLGRNDVELQGGIIERVRRELGRFSTTNAANGVTCTTECRLLSGYSARSQAELDALARDMTNKIVYDLQTGKIERGQMKTPNWFENRVADHFQTQQQQQQQHQSNQFQQQSQSQRSYGYIQPITTGNSYQRVVEEHHKEEHRNTAYQPQPIFTSANVLHQNNCTDHIQHSSFPHFNTQNQFNQRVESNRQINIAPTFIAPIGGGSSYHVSQTIERKEHRLPQVPIVIPTQNTYTRQYEEEQRQIHRQQPRPQIVGINQQNRNSHVETQRVHNVQIITPAPTPVVTRQDIYDHFYESEVVPNYKPRVTIDQNTKFHELEIRNRQQHRQPIIPTVTSRTHIEKEEEQIDRQYQQKPVVIPQGSSSFSTNEEVQVSQHVTQRPYIYSTPSTVIHAEKEEEQIDRQYQQKPVVIPQGSSSFSTNEEVQVSHHVTQRPYIYPTQNTITHTENEDVQTIRQQSRPQYPIFSHSTNVQSFNESRNTDTNTQTIYQQPSGHTVTTIKETHYVNTLPQPANQYTNTYTFTEEEYTERLNRIQQELRRLGYGTLSEEEYNATIASGGFIHNGYKYLYNADHGRYEKTEKVEINEEEYHSQLHGLQNQLQQLGIQMTEREFNQTIEDGYFVRNGVRYVFDSETRTYHRQDDQYDVLRQRILEESNRHGWALTSHEVDQTIATGVLVINGHRYNLDRETGVLVEGQDVQISEQEYRTILRRLQEQLQQLGFEQMTETEYNQTINSGYFVRGGQKYRYNADIGRYEQVEISEEEYNTIVTKLKETLQRLNYRQMSEHEMNQTIATGSFIRGGYQWTYNTQTGEANAVRIAKQFEDLSDTEYESIYRHLQALLKRLGYPKMSEIECNTAITSGTFSRGGNQWVYQPASGEFERIELTESEYNFRINRLLEILSKLGIEKTKVEQNDIIYRGNFYHGGHRYEYDTTSASFVQVQMSEQEYQERKRQLEEQLLQIGYGTMTDSECRATINSGIFYYGGHEWVYSYDSGKYEMGQLSDKENGIVDDNHFNNIGLDDTHYETSKKEDAAKQDKAFDIDKVDKNKRPKEIISKNRGDQPPQTFEEDYDESEEVSEKPARIQTIPTQAATRRPRPPAVTTPTPLVVSTVSNDYSRRVDSQRILQYAVPPPETEIEQRYHHKKTTYTQTSGYVPVNQEVLSRSRKSGSTGFDTQLNENPTTETHLAATETKTDIVEHPMKQTIEKVEETPVELHHDEEPTKTRFSGRKNLVDFFDSTTQIIETKAPKESTADFWNRLKEKANQWLH